jgi:hypothetical protein
MNPLLTKLFTGASKTLLNIASKPIDALTAKAVGTGIGALGGGIAGSAKAPEGQKGKGFAVGALTGGVGGYMGGKFYAGLGKGGVDAARIKGFAKELNALSASKTNTEALQGVGRYISKNWATPEHLKAIPSQAIQGPKHRPWFGLSAKAPVQQIAKSQGSAITRAIGNVTRAGMGIVDPTTASSLGLSGKNMLTRAGQILGREVSETTHYTKGGYRYKRSIPGKIMGATMMSGAGIGALEGATATNSNGTPAPIHKKIIKGTTSALGWGLAPSFMGAKMLSYDLPKSIINPES